MRGDISSLDSPEEITRFGRHYARYRSIELTEMHSKQWKVELSYYDVDKRNIAALNPRSRRMFVYNTKAEALSKIKELRSERGASLLNRIAIWFGLG